MRFSQKTTVDVADNSNDIQAYSQDDGIAIASVDVQSDDCPYMTELLTISIIQEQ